MLLSSTFAERMKMVAAVSVLFAGAGCSLSPSGEKVTLVIDVGGGGHAYSAIDGGGFSGVTAQTAVSPSAVDPGDPNSVPTDVSQFNCFVVNVSGPGIGGFNEGGSSWAPSGCAYPGVLSPIFSDSGKVVELDVPAGKDRRIQVIGLKVEGGGCPTGISFARLSGHRQPASEPMTHFRPYLLGERKTDLTVDMSVEIRSSYAYSDDAYHLDPFRCPAPGTGTAITSPSDLSGLIGWFDAHQLQQASVADLSSVSTWSNLGSNSLNLTSGYPPMLRHSQLNGRALLDFSGGASMTTAERLVAAEDFASPGMSLFVVATLPSDTVDSTMMSVSYGSAYLHYWGMSQTWDAGSDRYVNFFGFDTGANPVQVGSPLFSAAQPVILTGMKRQDGWMDYYANGVQQGGFAGVAGVPDDYHEGFITVGDGAFSGMIGEVLIYDREMTNWDREAVECYLGKRWNIGVNRTCP